jgi:hypothetical protein
VRFQILLIVAACCGASQAAELPEDTQDTKTLTVKQAQELLSEHGDMLWLDCLDTLTPELAKALTSHRGSLFLRGQTEPTLEVATALAEHQGFLSLVGLPTLSPNVAEALARHRNRVYLYDLKLTDEAAVVLRANPNLMLRE